VASFCPKQRSCVTVGARIMRALVQAFVALVVLMAFQSAEAKTARQAKGWYCFSYHRPGDLPGVFRTS
jgi:hypothetical protein